MKPRLMLLALAIAGLWLAPILSWVTVLEIQLSGYEVFPLTGLLPWLLLLFVFVANYSKRPKAISIIGGLVAAGTSVWLVIANLGTFSAVQESYESQTGLALLSSPEGVTVSGAHYLYSALLLVAAVALLLFEKTKRERVERSAESEFDARSLWEDQQ